VIDSIGDDLRDPGDVGEPEPSWADCPVLPRVDILAVIEGNRDLGGRALNLFRGGSEREPRLICSARSRTDIWNIPPRDLNIN
jgi:hypothetical protein